MLGLLVAADVAVRGVAEAQLEDRVDAELATAGGSDVRIESFPFLGRLLTSGAVARVRVSATEVTAERITFSRVVLDLEDVTFDRSNLLSDRTVVLESLGRGTAVAEVTQDRISDLLGVNVSLEPGRAQVRVAGRMVTANASVDDNTLRLTVAGLAVPALRIPRLSLLPCVADAEILAGVVRLTCEVDQLPAELVGRPLAALPP